MTVHRYSILTYRTKGANANVVYTFTNPDRLPNPRWNFGGGTTQAQGSTSGYTSGGGIGGAGAVNTIDKFPFASDANATDVGDLSNSTGRYWSTGQSSTTNGYTSGGYSYYGGGSFNIIDKFPFASNANATDVGDLISTKLDASRQGQISPASGYVSGGAPGFPRNPTVNVIEKFPFASNANASDVGDLTVGRYFTQGQSSTASGYTSGGYGFGTAGNSNVIDKFPFASNANATDVGDLTVVKLNAAGQSSSASGYTSGGRTGFSAPGTNIIDKFPFASNANATDVGDLSETRQTSTGQSSSSDGYTSGGSVTNPSPPPPALNVNTIDKFPFASDANATDVGDLTQGRSSVTGQNSSTHGYSSSGGSPTGDSNVIDKFPFASNANATDVGDLTVERPGSAGQSSTASGYTSGGNSQNVIDKFPFASDANATDVGDLTTIRSNRPAGQQV